MKFVKYLTLLIVALITFLSLSEFYTVEILGEIKNYTWGIVNENPWFYKSPNLYSKVLLIEGILYFIILTYLKYALIKHNDKLFKKGIIIFVIYFVVTIINGYIPFK